MCFSSINIHPRLHLKSLVYKPTSQSHAFTVTLTFNLAGMTLPSTELLSVTVIPNNTFCHLLSVPLPWWGWGHRSCHNNTFPRFPVFRCPQGYPIHSWVLVMKNISTTILSLRLIQERQLSVTGERISTVLVNCLGGLPKNSVARLSDHAQNDLKCVKGP